MATSCLAHSGRSYCLSRIHPNRHTSRARHHRRHGSIPVRYALFYANYLTDSLQIPGGIIWVNGKIIIILHWLGRSCAKCCRCLRDCVLCRCCRRKSTQQGRSKSSTAGDVALATAPGSGSGHRESNNNNSLLNVDRSPDKSARSKVRWVSYRISESVSNFTLKNHETSK